MRSCERTRLRKHLLSMGFKRTSASEDGGIGVYAEVFELAGSPDNMVTIAWGPRTPEPAVPSVTGAPRALLEQVRESWDEELEQMLEDAPLREELDDAEALLALSRWAAARVKLREVLDLSFPITDLEPWADLFEAAFIALATEAAADAAVNGAPACGDPGPHCVTHFGACD